MIRCAITDRTRFGGDEEVCQVRLLAHAEQWAADGVDLIQLREKDLEAGALAELARRLLHLLRAHRPSPRLVINSRADIAIAIAADGVHLTAQPGSLTPGQVRALYASASLPEPTVSISCHTLAEVARARNCAATLILFGPVFQKVAVEKDQNAPDQPTAEVLVSQGSGLGLLRAACIAAAPIPVLALGGVTPGNSAACVACGAAGIAGIRWFAM